MNNEERILSMLENLITKVDRIETDVAGLKADVSELKDGQVRLESRASDIHNNLAVLEAETKQSLGGLHDKWDDFAKKSDTTLEHQQIIESQLENYDLRLKRLEKRVLAG